MTSARDALYDELAPDLSAMTTGLFKFAEQQVRRRGGFPLTPALRADDRQVGILMGDSPPAGAGMAEIRAFELQRLQRMIAMPYPTDAVATIEWVSITGAGQTDQPAIKVHVHHRRGLAVIFYSPASREESGDWTFGDLIARAGDALIETWPLTV